MIEPAGDGSLKIVVASPDARQAVSGELARIVGAPQMRALDGAWLVHSSASTDELRDRLRAAAPSAGALFVAEFERWSSAGEVDAAWLSRRGH